MNMLFPRYRLPGLALASSAFASPPVIAASSAFMPERTHKHLVNPDPLQGYLAHKKLLLGPYSRTLPRALWRPWGGGQFLMGEVPLYNLVLSLPLAPHSYLRAHTTEFTRY